MKKKILLCCFLLLHLSSCNLKNDSNKNEKLVIYSTIKEFFDAINAEKFDEATSMFPFGNLGSTNSELNSLIHEIAEGVKGKELPPFQNLKYEYISANSYETSYYVVTVKFCENNSNLNCFELIFTFGNSVGYRVITSVSIMPNTRIKEKLK